MSTIQPHISLGSVGSIPVKEKNISTGGYFGFWRIHRHLAALLQDYTVHAELKRLKGQCREIFCFWFFSWISFPSFPPAPEYPIGTVSNFFENSRRYSQVKVQLHRYQRHRRQILPPVLLVLLIPVANLPPVSTIPAANLREGQRRQICHQCQSPRFLEKIWNGPNCILRGLGETDSWKKPEVENLMTMSL